MVFRTATVRCRAARHRTFVPCDQLFSSISFIVRCRAIGQRAKETLLQNYFCDDQCQQKFSPKYRAEMAFRTLVSEYLVVGTSDNLDLFMKCIEILMPKYFRGVNVDYQNSKPQLWNEFKTSFKRKPNPKTTLKLEQLLDTDIKFYQRVRQWFHKTCNLYV